MFGDNGKGMDKKRGEEKSFIDHAMDYAIEDMNEEEVGREKDDNRFLKALHEEWARKRNREEITIATNTTNNRDMVLTKRRRKDERQDDSFPQQPGYDRSSPVGMMMIGIRCRLMNERLLV